MKLVGQSFWHLISNNEHLYTDIIEPLGYKAKEHNETYSREKSRIVNVFTQEFINEFCDNGEINWKRVVQLNSGNMGDAGEEVISPEVVEQLSLAEPDGCKLQVSSRQFYSLKSGMVSCL